MPSTDPAWFAQTLGPDCSAPGEYRVDRPDGPVTVAYVLYRGLLIAAGDAAGFAAAQSALQRKIEAQLDLLQATSEITATREINLTTEHGDSTTRRFVRPMSVDRARIEFALGVDGALVFHEAASANFAIVCRGECGDPQVFRLGEPVHGDDAAVRPLPIPGRTPPPEHEVALRRDKLARVRPLLRCPGCRGELLDIEAGLRCDACDRDYPNAGDKPVLAAEPGYDASPQGQPESKNTYGQQVLSLIEKYRDGWVLDCGSGSPSLGFYNVVHLDLFAYPEVDLVTDGKALPFADASFDAVLSEAVLEHVRDPVAYTQEVARVLKPGGLARLDVAFMCPYHGYPDHYFNMTRSGLQLVVEQAGLEVLSLEAGEHQHPFITLSLVLNHFARGIRDPAKRQRSLDMPIRAALEQLGRGGGDPFDALSADAIDDIAAGFGCIARKPSPPSTG